MVKDVITHCKAFKSLFQPKILSVTLPLLLFLIWQVLTRPPPSLSPSHPSPHCQWMRKELVTDSVLQHHPLGVSSWLSCPRGLSPWTQEPCPNSGGLNKFRAGSSSLPGFLDRCSPGLFAAVSGELPWAVANFAHREFSFLRKPFWSH